MNIVDVNVIGGPDIRVTETRSRLGTGVRLDVVLHNDGSVPARAGRVGILIEQARCAQVLEHGWPSWSVVRIAGTGALTVVSDDLSRYTTKEWDTLAAAVAVMSEQDAPLDLVDPFSPTLTIRSARWELTVDWTVPSSRLRRRSAL